MAQGNPLPGEKYLHFKNKLYQVIAVAKHSETMEPYVVYQALYGDFGIYIRPYDMFISEVDHEKYPKVTQKYRFQYVEAETADSRSSEPKEQKTATDCEPKQQKTEADCEPKQQKTAADCEPEKDEDADEQINPWLLRFLDAETMEEKYQIVCDIKDEITDRLIDDLAVVVDVVIPEGKLSDRYAQLKYCIRTRQKYEQNSLWRK